VGRTHRRRKGRPRVLGETTQMRRIASGGSRGPTGCPAAPQPLRCGPAPALMDAAPVTRAAKCPLAAGSDCPVATAPSPHKATQLAVRARDSETIGSVIPGSAGKSRRPPISGEPGAHCSVERLLIACRGCRHAADGHPSTAVRSSGMGMGATALTLAPPVLPRGYRRNAEPGPATRSRTSCPVTSWRSRCRHP